MADVICNTTTAECRMISAQSMAQEIVANPLECLVQQTFSPPLREIESEQGRPWARPAPDQFLEAFQTNLREAEALETNIAAIENEADEVLEDVKGRLASLQKQQTVACFRAWKLVADGKVPIAAMEEYALEAGVKAHGNAKIPCSGLMRAIVASGVIKGTQTSQLKRARASTYASAIYYAIHEGMTEDKFTAELKESRKRGERHGIEHLAALGRKVRRAANSERSTTENAQALESLSQGGAFVVSGDFTDVTPGYRLVVINVPAENTITETRGQIIDPIDDALVRRVLQQWIKTRRTAEPRNEAPPPDQCDDVSHEALQNLVNTINSNRLN